MADFKPAGTLANRTFVGLLVAQFLAAFNDQAIHAAAMFFAIRKHALSEEQAIALMPILFYAPWAIFSTLAGYLADRYSKRSTLVFWKVAEVVICAVALGGFWLGTHGVRAGPWVVLSTVFLMGMHSAFFVPAKYGVMPEILPPQLLSRGNGLLESLSFLAVILGTVCGGVLSWLFVDNEQYWIGVVLLALAVVGAAASLLIRRMPAANPAREFPPYLYGPLWANLRALFGARPLAFAVIGIAFFTFIVAFMRVTVYMHGESQVPRWSELKTSVVVGMVALGIGVGSPLVGYLSGKKVELGLIPVGAAGMVVATALAAALLGWIPGLVVCVVFIGFFTGFYLVPLFTQLQHRAPKASKGDSIATSNFINVTGAILASVVFWLMFQLAIAAGLAPEIRQTDRAEYAGVLAEDPVLDEHGHLTLVQVRDADDPDGEPREVRADARTVIDPFARALTAGDAVAASTYTSGGVTHYRFRAAGATVQPVYDKTRLPALLFLSAAGMTLLTLFLLRLQMPDLYLRTLLWFRWLGRSRLEVIGSNHVPRTGPLIQLTNAASAEHTLHVLASSDRVTRFLLVERPGQPALGVLTRLPATVASLAVAPASGVAALPWDHLLQRAEETLAKGGGVGLSTEDGVPEWALRGLLDEVGPRYGAAVLPVCVEVSGPRVTVLFGPPLEPGATVDAAQGAIDALHADYKAREQAGTLGELTVAEPH